MILLSGLLVTTAALVPLGHIGFRDALQTVLKSFDIAVEQYARVSGTHWYELELTATDNLTLERISCRCPVVGTWKHGFIVLHQGQPRAVGQSEAQHHLLPVAARLIQGEPLRGGGGAGGDAGPHACKKVTRLALVFGGGGGAGGDAGPHAALAGQPD